MRESNGWAPGAKGDHAWPPKRANNGTSRPSPSGPRELAHKEGAKEPLWRPFSSQWKGPTQNATEGGLFANPENSRKGQPRSLPGSLPFTGSRHRLMRPFPPSLHSLEEEWGTRVMGIQAPDPIRDRRAVLHLKKGHLWVLALTRCWSA